MTDRFSPQAGLYAKYRPHYPSELFDFILSPVYYRHSAWDCATGNGQTAKELAKYFTEVKATDISQKQLDNAYRAFNVEYSLQPAEHTDFGNNSFDLITVSQALHWFDFDKFYAEVNRVAKPDAWLAIWFYSLLRISPGIDPIIYNYHFDTISKYYDEGRKYVDTNYETIPFVFPETKTANFSGICYWTLEELEGYFNTSSALHKYIAANGESPVPAIIDQIRTYWTDTKMKIVFPLQVKMGQVRK
jgi:SAM-dependent methyltransferase